MCSLLWSLQLVLTWRANLAILAGQDIAQSGDQSDELRRLHGIRSDQIRSDQLESDRIGSD